MSLPNQENIRRPTSPIIFQTHRRNNNNKVYNFCEKGKGAKIAALHAFALFPLPSFAHLHRGLPFMPLGRLFVGVASLHDEPFLVIPSDQLQTHG
jgi:hypothetical protein